MSTVTTHETFAPQIDTPDRRNFARTQVRFPIELRISTGQGIRSIIGTTLDVSPTGVRAELASSIPLKSEPIDVRISVPQMSGVSAWNGSALCRGTIVRRETSTPIAGMTRIAIKFTHPLDLRF